MCDEASEPQCSTEQSSVFANPHTLQLVLSKLGLVSLSRCSQVNRQWRETVAGNPSFWSIVDADQLWQEMSGQVLQKRVKRQAGLLNHALQSILASHAGAIQTLQMPRTYSPLSDPFFPTYPHDTLPCHLSNFELSVDEVASDEPWPAVLPGPHDILPWQVLLQPGLRLPKLQSLDVSLWPEWESPGDNEELERIELWRLLLDKAAAHAGSLKTLVARNAWGLDSYLLSLPAGGSSRGQLDVHSLDLKGTPLDKPFLRQASPGTNMMERMLDTLAQSSHLTRLALGWISEDKDGALGLEKRVHCMVTSSLLDSLSLNASTLTHLDLSGLLFHAHRQFGGPQAHKSLLGPLTKLTTLNLAGVMVNSVSSTFMGLGAWRPSALVGLNLRGCDWVQSFTLQALLPHVPTLERLNISCCEGVRDDFLSLLPSLCSKLTLLDVCYCSAMSKEALVACVRSLPLLTDVGFSGFKHLTDEDVADMLQACGSSASSQLPSNQTGRLVIEAAEQTASSRVPCVKRRELQMIGLGGCPLLTDQTLLSVAATCGEVLRSIYMADLPLVTDKGLKGLVETSPMLAKVCSDRCTGLSADIADDMRHRFPYIYDGDTHA